MKITLTTEEEEYRSEEYPDVSTAIEKFNLITPKCTICFESVECDKIFSHPVLEVLLCRKCYNFYNQGEFSTDEDGSDKYCRWCGQGGTLYCCSKCHCVFCRPCVKRNCEHKILRDIEEEDWECFVCDVKPLWKSRALCWVIMEGNKKKERGTKLKNKKALDNLDRKKKGSSRSARERSNHRSSTSDSDEQSDNINDKSSRQKRKKRYGTNKRRRAKSTSDSEETIQNKKQNLRGAKPGNNSVKTRSVVERCISNEEESSDAEEKRYNKSGHVEKPRNRLTTKTSRTNHGINDSESDAFKNINNGKSKLRGKNTFAQSECEDGSASSESETTNQTKQKWKPKASNSNINQIKLKKNSIVRKTVDHQENSSDSDDVEEHSKSKCVPVTKIHPNDRMTNKKLTTRREYNSIASNQSDDSASTTHKKSLYEEELSDGTSKDGAGEEPSLAWLQCLIQDYHAFLSESSKKSLALTKLSEGLETNTVHQVCKILYKRVKTSQQYLEIFKSHVVDDYSKWRLEEIKKKENDKKRVKDIALVEEEDQSQEESGKENETKEGSEAEEKIEASDEKGNEDESEGGNEEIEEENEKKLEESNEKVEVETDNVSDELLNGDIEEEGKELTSDKESTKHKSGKCSKSKSRRETNSSRDDDYSKKKIDAGKKASKKRVEKELSKDKGLQQQSDNNNKMDPEDRKNTVSTSKPSKFLDDNLKDLFTTNTEESEGNMTCGSELNDDLRPNSEVNKDTDNSLRKDLEDQPESHTGSVGTVKSSATTVLAPNSSEEVDESSTLDVNFSKQHNLLEKNNSNFPVLEQEISKLTNDLTTTEVIETPRLSKELTDSSKDCPPRRTSSVDLFAESDLEGNDSVVGNSNNFDIDNISTDLFDQDTIDKLSEDQDTEPLESQNVQISMIQKNLINENDHNELQTIDTAASILKTSQFATTTENSTSAAFDAHVTPVDKSCSLDLNSESDEEDIQARLALLASDSEKESNEQNESATFDNISSVLHIGSESEKSKNSVQKSEVERPCEKSKKKKKSSHCVLTSEISASATSDVQDMPLHESHSTDPESNNKDVQERLELLASDSEEGSIELNKDVTLDATTESKKCKISVQESEQENSCKKSPKENKTSQIVDAEDISAPAASDVRETIVSKSCSQDSESDEEDVQARLALLESDSEKESTSTKAKKMLQKEHKAVQKSKHSKQEKEDKKIEASPSKKKIGPKSKVPLNNSDVLDEDLSANTSSNDESTEKSHFIISNLDEFKKDKKLNVKCAVMLDNLENVGELHDKTNKKKSRNRKTFDCLGQRIYHLANLDTVLRKRKNNGSEEDEEDKQKKKTKPKLKKRKEEGENEKAVSSDSDIGTVQEIDESDHDSNFNKSTMDKDNEFALQALLEDDNNSDSCLADDIQKEEGKDKERKKKVQKEKKTEKEEEGRKVGSEDEGADEEKEEKKKKAAWRNAKELRQPLSEMETTDDEANFEKKKARGKELKKKSEFSSSDEEAPITLKKKKTKVKRRVFNSDSDVSENNSDNDFVLDANKSDSNSSGNEFATSKKKKGKNKRAASSGDSNDSSESDKKKNRKRRRIKKMADSDDSDDGEGDTQKSEGTPKGRKNIKKILKDTDLTKETRSAAKEEEERKKRIAERQKMYNEMYDAMQKKDATLKELVLDFDPETKTPIVSVAEKIVAKLKPHQAQGIKFMWDACFESVERSKKGNGSGCILAHCMGLGKTLQVVALVHTILNIEDLGVKTVLVVTPLSTVQNWVNEFSMWLNGVENGDEVEVFNLSQQKLNRDRMGYLKDWQKFGGVMVMGYDMFRNLTNINSKAKKNVTSTFQSCLVDPGADLVVCDEGHLLKNEASKLSQGMSRIKTLRRIVLTGTPLQNNLVEYHCMIQFVKPNLLGVRKEFTNRFVNPIKNGQCADSTERDVKVMKRRAHVLHKMLEGLVQRFDYSVLTPFLPPKQEYVISVRLTQIQITLYQHYLDNLARQSQINKGATLFKDYQSLQRCWTHPKVLQMIAERNLLKMVDDDDAEESEGSLREFIDDDEASDSKSSSSSSSSGSDSDVQMCDDDDDKAKKKKKKPVVKNVGRPRTRGALADGVVDDSDEEKENKDMRGPSEWWHQFVKTEDLDVLMHSNKLALLFSILRECEAIGDKILVFSQSLLSLDLIEHFLKKVDDGTQQGSTNENLCRLTGSWDLGLDYFRIDGSTSVDNRSMWCKTFNNQKNLRARLFLISTRAGGLGINLVAANRVILFDASWNPSHDVQSIFRIYRFGQKKPCYVYRFLACGTMEEKIYDRQVTKLALSGRVVDEHQIDRHFNAADLEELYSFNPLGSDAPGAKKTTLMVPKDRMLAELLKEHGNSIETYHEHDSLLENKAEEVLTEAERQEAWEDYENEKKGIRNPLLDAENWDEMKMQLMGNMTPELDNNMLAALQGIYKYHGMQGLQGMQGMQGMQNLLAMHNQMQNNPKLANLMMQQHAQAAQNLMANKGSVSNYDYYRQQQMYLMNQRAQQAQLAQYQAGMPRAGTSGMGAAGPSGGVPYTNSGASLMKHASKSDKPTGFVINRRLPQGSVQVPETINLDSPPEPSSPVSKDSLGDNTPIIINDDTPKKNKNDQGKDGDKGFPKLALRTDLF